MFKNRIFVLALLGILSACSSGVKRGSVAMKLDERTAHVAMNRGEVEKGDHVELYTNQCRKDMTQGGSTCRKINKGHGQIVSILNDEYAEVKFDEGAQFSEGDFIEKHSH